MSDWMQRCWTVAGIAAIVGFAAVMWGYRRDRSRGRRRCPRCWYDMAGVPGLTCPECGSVHKREKTLFAARPSRRMMTFGVVLVTVAVGLGATPALVSGTWVRHTPITLLRLLLSAFESESVYKAQVANNTPADQLTAWQRLLLAKQCAVVLRTAEVESTEDTTQDLSSMPVQSSRRPLPVPPPSNRTPYDEAIDIAATLGDQARPVLPELAQVIDHSNYQVRLRAIRAVSSLGAVAKPIVPRICELARSSPDKDRRVSFVDLLDSLGIATPEVRSTLTGLVGESREPQVAMHAAIALVRLDPDSEVTVEVVAPLLRSSDLDTQRTTVELLEALARGSGAQLGSRALRTKGGPRIWQTPPIPGAPVTARNTAAVAVLAASLDTSEYLRYRIAFILQGFDQLPVTCEPILSRAIDREPDGFTRRMLISAYASAGGTSCEPLIPEIVSRLHAPSNEDKLYACATLRRFGSRAGSAAPAVRAAVERQGAVLFIEGCRALSAMGPAGWGELARVIAQDETASPVAARFLAEAAGRDPKALDELIALSTTGTPLERARAVQGLAACPHLSRAAEVLVQVVTRDPDADVRRAALVAVADAGDTDAMLTVCEREIADADASVQAVAFASLRFEARLNNRARAILENAAHHERADVRKLAADTLEQVH